MMALKGELADFSGPRDTVGGERSLSLATAIALTDAEYSPEQKNSSAKIGIERG